MSHDQCDKELLEYVKKTSPAPFLLKTYMLVEDPVTDVVISWNTDGTAFVVWHIDEFSRDLLPSLFKHSNFSSFVRQLNTYGFRKISTSRWEFYNEMFRKGERELLCNIRRRKAWEHKLLRSNAPTQMTTAPKENDVDQESSSTSSSSSSRSNSLLEENKRLRRENEILTSELTSMKNKCNELLKMVAVNTNNMEQQDDTNMNHDQSLMIFGVRLNVSSMSKTVRPVEIN